MKTVNEMRLLGTVCLRYVRLSRDTGMAVLWWLGHSEKVAVVDSAGLSATIITIAVIPKIASASQSIIFFRFGWPLVEGGIICSVAAYVLRKHVLT